MKTMFSPRNRKLLIVFLLLLMVSLACNMPGREATPTPDPGALYTVAAQTLEAQMTQSAANPQATQSVPSPTAQPGMPTNTPQPPTQTQPPATNTPKPTLTPSQVPCDYLEFVDDVTIEDGTEIDSGEPFEKIWRLKNAGSCTWNSDYDLVFDSGDKMNAPDSQQLTTGTVAPGQEFDVKVALTAPDDPGEYRGNFKLRNPGGTIFGLGNQSKPFWVEIVVPGRSGVMLDFLVDAKNADWGSGVEPVDFAGPGHNDVTYGGPDTDTNGFAMIKDGVKLESGKVSGKILETHPKWENNGYIVGKFPAYKVGAGDYIKGQIGFIAKADGSCGVGSVTFEIHYTKGDDLGTRTRLGKWTKACNGQMQSINVDLADLKGETVRFYLVVLANGAADQDWAVWSSLGVMR
ncbi:MAG TPA: hypothetical protein DEH25_16830 [Chloroflexi bacterium]|nr:hypothetical protein [Chloroflexota bacterium]